MADSPGLTDAPRHQQTRALPAQVALGSDTLRVTVDTGVWRLRITGAAGEPLWEAPEVDTGDQGAEGDGPYGPPAFMIDGRWERLAACTTADANDTTLVLETTTAPSGLAAQVTIELAGAAALRLRARLLDRPAEQVAISAVAPTGEKFLGFGEQFSGVDQRGRTVPIWADDRRAAGYGNSTYLPVPLLLSSRGYSLLLDGPARARFDLASVRPGALAAVVDAPEIALTLTYGPHPADLVRAYAQQTGLPPLPPVWAFGVVKTSIGGQQRVLADAQRLREAGAPVSAIWSYDLVDAEANVGWPDQVYGNVRNGTYPDPRGLAQRLHALGLKLTGYFTLHFRPEQRGAAAGYAAANAAGYLVQSPDGGAYRHPSLDVAWLDFTNPAAVAWWQTKVRRALVDLDLDGGMVDFGELVPADAIFSDGRTGLQAHNDVPTLYHGALWAEAQRTKPESVFWMRSGTTGDQRFHTATWSGDPIDCWEPVTGIKSLVPAALSAGLSGYPYWHTEVSGYVQALTQREPQKELWLRWLQLGAFCPLLRDNYGEKPYQPVDVWTDAETLGEYVRYATIHQRLVPYLYSLAREASESGLPLIRHLALEYPDDPVAWQVEDAYLLGRDLLIAPVTEPHVTSRPVYLPAGEWVDWWTGERRNGGGVVLAAADRHTIPVFVRAGAVLPLLPNDVRSLVEGVWDQVLVLQMTPASTPTSSIRQLYCGATVATSVSPTGGDVAVSGDRWRTYHVRLPFTGAAEVLEGQPAGPAQPGKGATTIRIEGASIRVRVGEPVG